MGSDRITEVPKLADLTHAHTLVIKSTHEYKVHGPYGSNFPYTIGPMSSFWVLVVWTQKGAPGPYGTWKVGTIIMAHGPCIHEYVWWPEYEHRLGRQVKVAPWFYPTPPLKQTEVVFRWERINVPVFHHNIWGRTLWRWEMLSGRWHGSVGKVLMVSTELGFRITKTHDELSGREK